MAETSDVLFTRDGHIATVTLNRPQVMNAYSGDTLKQLEPMWDEIANNPEIWVAVLTGAGERAFCAGHDIRWMSRVDPIAEGIRPEFYGEERVRYFHGYGAYGFDIRKPVIAAINGACVGGGLTMALRCDIRIAVEHAKFGLAQVKRGVLSPIGAVYLPRMIGLGPAMEMLLTGETFDAEWACRVGLINRVVPADKLMAQTYDLAERICQAAPLAVQATKQIANQSLTGSLETTLFLSHQTFAQLRTTKDSIEGAQSFLEKRPPQWSGS